MTSWRRCIARCHRVVQGVGLRWTGTPGVDHNLPEHSGGCYRSRHFALQADRDMRSPMIAKSRPHVVIHTTHSSILCRVTTVSGEKMSHIEMEGETGKRLSLQ